MKPSEEKILKISELLYFELFDDKETEELIERICKVMIFILQNLKFVNNENNKNEIYGILVSINGMFRDTMKSCHECICGDYITNHERDVITTQLSGLFC